MKWYHKLIIIISSLFLVSMGTALFALWKTNAAYHDLQSFRFTQATEHAKSAQQVVSLYSLVTFHQLPDVEIWQTGLSSIKQATSLSDDVTALLPKALQNGDTTNQSHEIVNRFQQLTLDFSTIIEQLPKTFLAQHILGNKRIEKLRKLNDHFTDLNVVLHQLVNGNQRYLLLFQNSEELRATGGFIGSYGIIELNDGTLTSLQIGDIYDPDGQFPDFVEAPPGLNEYLSSGKGMRLPDANWSPDFPTAAQDVLQFFARGKEKKLDGVIAIELSFVEDILRVTGPIYLSDYQQEVTADNLSLLARAERDQFFPGSQQKKHYLQALFNQLKQKISSLTPEQQRELVTVFEMHRMRKGIQFFAHNQGLQEISEKYGFSGEVTTTPVSFTTVSAEKDPKESPDFKYLFLVESNVGINKANKEVVRRVNIQDNPNATTVLISYTNQNALSSSSTKTTPDANLHYINYQRIFLQPTMEVEGILINQQPVKDWHDDLITTSHDEKFRQVGFLVTVPEQVMTTVEIHLKNTHPTAATHWLIQKQAGVPPTEYTIEQENQTYSWVLDQDTWVKF